MTGAPRVETGVKRLDQLLGGGLPPGSASLVYGPPFVGRDVLARVFALNGMRRGVPAVVVLTDKSASDLRRAFLAMDPRYAEFEKAGLALYVDTYSKSIGAAEEHAATEYVDSPVNLNGMSLGVNNAERRIIGGHAEHNLVFDSVSTLIAYTNAQTAFRFLQVLIGKTRRAGATSMLLLDAGMHTEAEVQMVKHLADGVLDFKSENEKHLLHVSGLGAMEAAGWVEYKSTEKDFEITGSFAAGRIK